ncbi:MAG TPA: sugar phosphate isomerase/epimerase family protein [Candidatus Bathyarchaeia archaeon]
MKGFKNLEITTFEHQFTGDFDKCLQTLLSFRNQVKYVSIHAPSYLTVAHIEDEAHRKLAVQCIEKIVQIAPQIECERVVFHGFHYVTDMHNMAEVTAQRRRAFSKCAESIKRLERVAIEFGVKLCLENLNAYMYFDKPSYLIFGASPMDIVRVAKETDSNVRLCFDAAHFKNFCSFLQKSKRMRELYGVNKPSLKDLFGKISDRVEIVHVSDAKGYVAGLKETEHLPLGMGEIDFEGLFKEICASDFDGPIVLETQELDINNAINMAEGRRCIESILAKIVKAS